MKQNNFEPDYKAWFEKTDPKKEEVCWLVLGINPDDANKYMKLLVEVNNYIKLTPDKKEEEKTKHEENIEWNSAFVAYLGTLPHHGWQINKSRYEYLFKKHSWDGDIKCFIQSVYEDYWEFLERLKTYLVESSILKINPKLESYNDHAQFKFDFRKFEIDSINKELEAFSILLGLNPEHFMRFYKLHAEKENTAFSTDDNWFYMGYMEFLIVYYEGHLYAQIIGFYEEAKKLNLWNNNFEKYAKNLCNEGFIFKRVVREFLEKLYKDFAISPSSSIAQIYKWWFRKGVCTFHEAVSLYKGICPQSESYLLHDLSQNPYILDFWSSWKVYVPFIGKPEELIEILEGRVAIGQIKQYKRGDSFVYCIKEISKFLMEYSFTLPPEVLLMQLGEDVRKNYEDNINEYTQNSQNASQSAVSAKMLEGASEYFYEEGRKILNEYFSKGLPEPSKMEIAKELKKRRVLRWKVSSIQRFFTMQELKKEQ